MRECNAYSFAKGNYIYVTNVLLGNLLLTSLNISTYMLVTPLGRLLMSKIDKNLGINITYIEKALFQRGFLEPFTSVGVSYTE